MARSASDVAEIDEIQKTDYICTSKESERPAPDTLDETLPLLAIFLSFFHDAKLTHSTAKVWQNIITRNMVAEPYAFLPGHCFAHFPY